MTLYSLIRLVFQRISFACRHGTFAFGLHRPDNRAALRGILSERPDFDEDIFRSYWPTREHADTALKLLDVVSGWNSLSGKMVYPNDAFQLLFGGVLMPENGSEYICSEDLYEELSSMRRSSVDISKLTPDSTFAELVETYMTAGGEGQ